MNQKINPAGIKPRSIYNWENMSFWMFWLYFGFKGFFFATQIRGKIFPDEVSWFGISEVYSRALFLPENSPESYPFGLVTHIPNLYFLFMGKILNLNVFPIDDLIFLRSVNVILGLVTILYTWRLVRLLSESVAVRLLTIVMVTNTIMFTFMFAAVSYDNLASLLAAMSLYYLISFFKKRASVDLLMFAFWGLAGTLTKVTFLPYMAVLILALIVHERIFLFKRPRNSCSLLLSLPMLQKWLMLGCLILLSLNVNLYAFNKINYGSVIPDMAAVLPVEDCLQNRLFAKAYAVKQFKNGTFSLMDAQRLVLQIRDPGDRINAWDQLNKVENEKNNKNVKRLGFLSYSLEWVEYMFARTFGIAAHIFMVKDVKSIYSYYFVFLLATALCLVHPRNCFSSEIIPLWIISGGYIAILMRLVNYKIYLASGYVGMALTGRYLFLVLVPIYFLVARAMMEKMPKWWQYLVGVAVGIIFIYGEFPWFLQNVTPEWYL